MGKARNLANLLADGAVGTTEIADSAVTTAKINNAAVTQAKLETLVVPVGVGQTWQDVLGSRASGVTYTNTTGRPIMVSFQGASSSGVPAHTISVNGLIVAREDQTSGAQDVSLAVIVPNGATYVCSSPSGVRMWVELR